MSVRYPTATVVRAGVRETFLYENRDHRRECVDRIFDVNPHATVFMNNSNTIPKAPYYDMVMHQMVWHD